MRHMLVTALSLVALSLLALAPAAGAAPTAAFRWSPTVPNPGQTVTFSTSGTVCDVAPCTYRWTDVAADGPGTPDYPITMSGSAPTFTFRFVNLGTKYVQLQVTNALSQTSTVQHDLVVAPAPSWSGDFDTCDASQWPYAQSGQGWPLLFGNSRIDPVTGAATRPNAGCAARFQVDTWTAGAPFPDSQRAEVHTPLNLTEDDEYWFGTSIYIPSTYRSNWQVMTHNTLTQWKGDGTGAPPLQIGAPYWGDEDEDGLGVIVADDRGGIRTWHRLVPFADMFDTWHDFAVRVKFSSDAAVGEYEVWLDGVQVVATRRDRTLVPDRDSYLKQGLYTGNPNGGKVAVIDETRRGTSRAAVDPSLLLVD